MCPARIACHYHRAWRRPARPLREIKIGQFRLKAGDASLPVRSTAGFSAAYDSAFDIKAVASPNAGSDLTLVIRT